MKTSILLIALCALPLQAQYQGPAATQKSYTVASILQQKDDTKGTMEGYIINSLGDEKYTFRDKGNTGTIVVEIDRDKLPHQAFNEKTLVRITGELDKSRNERTEFEVDRVEILSN